MSRIQMILDKADREGTTRRFRHDLRLADRTDRTDRADRADSGESAERVDPATAEDVAHEDAAGEAAREDGRVTDVVPPPAHVARSASSAPFEPPVSLAPVDVIGTVDTPEATPTPAVGADEGGDRAGGDPESAHGSGVRASSHLQVAPALVAALHPNALASEQFRTLRTRIANSANGRGARALLMTSPGRGEGKSVMAANLALTMGQEIQQRVCLVDASLRDASVHHLFGLPDSPGLVDVLNGDATLDEALVVFDEYQLSVLPAGKLPRHPAELLAGREMRRLLDQLRTQFDRVVIDAPPVLPMADVSILAPLVDGVLMVVRAGVTATPDLQRALGGLDASRVLGVVLNDLQV